MTGENRVHIRRIDPSATAPVMVAARLATALDEEHHVRLVRDAPEPELLCVSSRARDLTERVTAVLAESRFRGWALEGSHDDTSCG